MLTGKKIRQIRTAKNLTQYDLAEKIGNLSQSQIAKIENGTRKITDIDLKRFAEALNVTIEDLIN